MMLFHGSVISQTDMHRHPVQRHKGHPRSLNLICGAVKGFHGFIRYLLALMDKAAFGY